VLDTIVAKAVQLSGTDAGTIYGFDELSGEFQVRAAYGMSEELIASLALHHVGLSEALAHATGRRIPVQVADLRTEPPVPGQAAPVQQIVLEAGYRARMIVPLLDANRVVGALAVRRKMPGKLPETTEDLLQTFAAQSVLAIQNARLANWNRTLEQRVAEQVAEIERIGRLKRFLPRQIAKLVVSSGHERILESHRRQVTVLFCDLRGFTAFSEISEPEEVMLVLREYHTALGVLVDKFEGTVERFTGDGLLVIFNDPLPCPDPSIRAVQMAVEMRDEVTKLSGKWSRSGHDIGFGIGVAHGYATLGTVGYEGQFQYSVTGKVANLASRLCNEAKNGQILIDINVFSAVETRADAEFTEELILKGFSRPVKAFNVRNLRS
jgi:class 3 adenylate cyclase